KSCEFHNLFFHIACEARFYEYVGIRTSKNGYRNDLWNGKSFAFAGLGHSISHLLHHVAAPCGMNIEHPNAEPSCFHRCPCHSVRNVVKLKIQENTMPLLAQLLAKAGPRRDEKPQADLEGTDCT